MAQAATKDGEIVYKVNDDGSHSIGVKLEGVFVPFITREGHIVADAVARAKSPEWVARYGEPEGGE